MEWNESFNTGIEIIDEQHQSLISHFNKLQSSITKGDASQEIGNILKFLVDYTKFHFKSEEKLMTIIKYPDLTTQKKDHQEFVNKIVNYLMKLKEGRAINTFNMMHFLINWITKHIMKEDRKIGEFIRDNNILVPSDKTQFKEMD